MVRGRNRYTDEETDRKTDTLTPPAVQGSTLPKCHGFCTAVRLLMCSHNALVAFLLLLIDAKEECLSLGLSPALSNKSRVGWREVGGGRGHIHKETQ